jgi:transketolase
MRQAFLSAITALASNDPQVMLLTGDTGFHVFDQFREQFPAQFLNVGIAEAAMIGMAAGLALSGKKVFVYGIAPFVTLRCLEQIRVDLCYQRLPVIIVGVGAGLTYGTSGSTHHTIEDCAVLNSLPGMTVLSPGDPAETLALVQEAVTLAGPCYLRIGKSGEPAVHPSGLTGVRIGQGITLHRGSEVAVIATGTMLAGAHEACRLLAGQGVSTELISMHTLKPLDQPLVMELARRFPVMVTVEEHTVIGGLGAMVAMVLATMGCGVRLFMAGIPDQYADPAASQEALRARYHLTPGQLAARIVDFVRQGAP